MIPAAYGTSSIHVHGRDAWEGRRWNSISWGSKNSPVSTKMYDKSLELKEAHDKFWIRDAWRAAGLRDDDAVHVWRVEFSVKSDIKHYLQLDTGVLTRNDLSQYDDRQKILFRFHAFAARYFHFKQVTRKPDGTLQRKDRCPDKRLFFTSQEEKAYKPIRLTTDSEPTRTDKILINRLRQIVDDPNNDTATRKAAQQLLVYFTQHKRVKDLEAQLQTFILKRQ